MKRSKANRRILIGVAIGAVLVLGGVVGRLGPVGWLYSHTVSPLGSGLAAAGLNTAQMLSDVTQVRNLARQNAQLTQENSSLRQRLAADSQTRSDNELLRKQLGLNVAGTPRELAAEVIAFAPDSYRQFATINRGSRAGVRTGMAVLSEGVLLGTVNSVQPTTARILLVTDPEFRLTAKDQEANITGLVEGQLGGGLALNEIAQDAPVKAGDTVTTSGLGGVVPAGLLIGQVESVNAGANAVFQSAAVQTSLQFNELRFAFVVVGNGT